MQASDNSLGPYLRSEREQQGIDLQDVAELTKIQPKFIEAIEDDAYDRLPKGPFVVGFLRSYAECLSIDPDEVVTFYQASFGAPAQSVSLPPEHAAPAEHPAPEAQPAPKPPASSRRRGMLRVGLVGLACVLLYTVWSGLSGPRVTPDPDTGAANKAPAARPLSTPSDLDVNPTTAPAVTDAPQVDAAPADQPAAVPQTDTAAADQPAAPLSEASAPELAPLVLRVYAVEKTWMRLDIDEETSQEAMIEAGQSQSWQSKEQFSLTIGNVRGVRVFLNDQELDLPETRSNVLRDYVLTRALLNPRHTD